MTRFLGLITRCKDEPFVKEFCFYYLSQGVDKIYIMDDNSRDKNIYRGVLNNKKIKIIHGDKLLKSYQYDRNPIQPLLKPLQQLYTKIKNKFIWIIHCDMDEYITTKLNIKNTIRKELETTFRKYDCIRIPWVMMSCNGRKKNPKSLLLENNYRWNHDKKHPQKKHKFRCRYDEIEVKCIFKTSKYNSFNCHIPLDQQGKANITNSINLSNETLVKNGKKNIFYKNLREKDIKSGYLLCYHYRIISRENNLKKIKPGSMYNKKGITLSDLEKSDHAEIKDDTFKNEKKLIN